MKNCGHCGKPFAPAHASNMRTQKFCSKRCGHEARSARAGAAFWTKVDKSAPGGCWVWRGYCQRFGHGWLGNKRGLAHRYAWTLLRGPLKREDCLLHRCDNPPCVNPDHLFIGDRIDNWKDSAQKGRQFVGRQGNICNHKLNADDVLEIRRLRHVEKLSVREIQKRYPFVNPLAIYNAARGRSWSHLPMPVERLPQHEGEKHG